MKAFRVVGSIAALAAFGAACSGGSSSSSPVGGDDAHKLTDGHYAFVIDNVPSDTCWAPPKTNPETPMTIGGEFTVDGNDVTIVTDASGSIPSQTLNLTKDGNDLTGGGSGPADLNSQGINCVLQIDGTFDGLMTGLDEFDATMSIDVAQLSGDCSILVGSFLADQLDQLPCALTLTGSGKKN